MIRFSRPSTSTAVFLIAVLSAAMTHAQTNQQASVLRADTEKALATLRAHLAPADQSLIEARRAAQSLAGAAERIETASADLKQQRLSFEEFGAELDAILEEAVITTWDVSLAEARQGIETTQQFVDGATDLLRLRWNGIVGEIGNREGLSAGERQSLIDAAAPPIRDAERDHLETADQQLAGIAKRLTSARQVLLDLVTARIAAAEQAKRMMAAGRLTTLVEEHFESAGPAAGVSASSFDQLLAAAQLNVPTIVIRGEPQRLALADRVRPLIAGRAKVVGHKELVEREPDRTPWIFATIPVRATLTADPRNPNAFASGDRGVTLAVFGAHLTDGDPGRVSSGTPGVEYTVIGSLPGAFLRTKLAADNPLRMVYDAALVAVKRDLPPNDGQLFELADVVLITARLKPGMLPSLQTFTLAGVEGLWPLKFATTRGTIEIVRPRPARQADEVDRPDEVFVFDRFAVQIETEDPLEVDELSVIVLHNGAPLVPRKNADSAPADAAGGGRQDGILVARKVPGFPRLLRTSPVFIEGRVTPDRQLAKATHYAPMKEGDVVFATTDGMIFDAPVADVVAVYVSPDKVRVLFSQAIADAAKIHRKEITDLNIADEGVVDTITHTVVFNWQRHQISFSLFDHAALLLMKRTFLHLAGQRLEPLRKIYGSEDAIRAYIPTMKAQFEEMGRQRRNSEHGDIPFPLLQASLRVPPNLELLPQSPIEKAESTFGAFVRPGGPRSSQAYGTAPLSTAFWDSSFAEWFKDPSKIDVWQFHATREVLRLQIQQLTDAIAYAESCDDDDIEELLELTGRGFGPVREQIYSRLLYFKSDVARQTTEWLPHERARVALTNLASALEEHDTAYKAAKADTEALLAAVTAIGVVATGGTAILGKVILAAASAVAIGTASRDVYDLLLDKQETQFARNAIDIIGRDRFLFAYQRDSEIGAMPYVTLALSVVGFRLDIADLVNAVRVTAARRVAEQWMKHVASEGFEALVQVPIKDKSIVYILIREAEDAKAAGRQLTTAQQAALDAGATIERQLAAADAWRGRTAIPAYRPDDHVVYTPPVSGNVLPLDEIPHGMPKPGYLLEAAGANRLFMVGQPFGAGAYATTYRLLDDQLKETADVAKFLRESWEESTGRWVRDRMADGQRTLPEMFTHAMFDSTPLPEVIDRMIYGQKLLADAGIPHLPMRTLDDALGQAGRDSIPPFVVQKKIPEGPDFFLPNTKNPRLPDPQMHDAVAVLYKQIADAGLIWKDGHIGNIYFERVGGKWTAGILDSDMLVRWDDAIENEFLRGKIHMAFALPGRHGIHSLTPNRLLLEADATPNIARMVAGSPHEFMAKMLEHKGWIAFHQPEAAAGVFEGRVLNIEAVRRQFGDPAQYVRR